MVATQTQIRRDTATNLDAATPANAELAYDMTNKRLRLGDGTTQGGTIIPNAFDTQRNFFNFAVAGGSANALTVDLPLSPPSYFQPLTVRFRATQNNTGPVTINVNGLGTRDINKFVAGSPVPLLGNEILSGGMYEAIYDGVRFLISGAQQETTVSPGSYVVVAFNPFRSINHTQPETNRVFLQLSGTLDPASAMVLAARMPYNGTISTSFKMKKSATGGANVQGEWRINGTAVGINRSTNSGTYQNYTEDISVSAGDRLELWLTRSPPNTVQILDVFLSVNENLPSFPVEFIYN